MMAALALALTVQTTPPADEQEIVVLSRRLDAMYADVRRARNGKLSCETNRTTGNRYLDDALCRAAIDCVRDGAYDSQSGRTCIDQRKPAMLAEVRQRMAQRRRR